MITANLLLFHGLAAIAAYYIELAWSRNAVVLCFISVTAELFYSYSLPSISIDIFHRIFSFVPLFVSLCDYGRYRIEVSFFSLSSRREAGASFFISVPLYSLIAHTKTGYLQYGFVCVVTGATQPVGEAIVTELAGKSLDLKTVA